MKIRQSSSFLVTLLREVSAGRLLPAAMQRPYVWRKTDVEALCDSVLSGFPIGSFLMWAPGTKADLSSLAMGRLGPIESAGKEQPHAHQLLDGQNRLATLGWMMADQPPVLDDLSPAEVETWAGPDRLVLDFDSRSVKFMPAGEAEDRLRLPAWTLVSTSDNDEYHKAMSMIRQLGRGKWAERFSEAEVDAFVDFWDRCRDRFKDARTTETVIEDATAAEARHAFLRICRVGVPLAQEDFDRALGWTPDIPGGEAAH